MQNNISSINQVQFNLFSPVISETEYCSKLMVIDDKVTNECKVMTISHMDLCSEDTKEVIRSRKSKQRTDNTLVKIKRTIGETMTYKTLHRN